MIIRTILFFLTAIIFTISPADAADLDGNGRVDRGDVDAMKAAFYTANPNADLNADGIVNFGDLALLRAAFDRAAAAPDGATLLGAGLPSVTLLPSSQEPDLLQTIELELWMDFSADPTIGGGIDIAYDAIMLDYLGFEFDAAFPDEPEFRNFPDTSEPGVLTSLAFGHFDGIAGPHLVGRLGFQAVAVGSSDLTMDDDSDGPAGPFVSAVTFVPQSVEFFGAQVHVIDVPLGAIAVDPLSIVFPDTVIGEQSFAAVTVSNVGDADLTIGVVGSGDPLSAPFSVEADACSLQVLPAAGECVISLAFSADSLATVMDTFDVPSDDFFNSSVSVDVDGTGIPMPEPMIAVQPNVVSFGSLIVGEIAEAEIEISNLGDADLIIFGIAGDNPLNAPFFIVADGCTGQTVIPADLCTLSVQFAPNTAGMFGDVFDISSNDPNQPMIDVSLFGSSTTPPADVSALIIGVYTAAAQCDNLSTGQSVPVPLAGTKFFNCEEQGLTVDSGDNIRILVRGITPSPVFIGGGAEGIDVQQVICVNGTSGENVIFQPQSDLGWNCVAQGLGFNPLDKFRMAIWGFAD